MSYSIDLAKNMFTFNGFEIVSLSKSLFGNFKFVVNHYGVMLCYDISKRQLGEFLENKEKYKSYYKTLEKTLYESFEAEQ